MQITTPTPHHKIFTGQMLFLMPNQQCQSTEGNSIGVTSYGALGHVPPLELGHVKKFGSFYDNNKH